MKTVLIFCGVLCALIASPRKSYGQNTYPYYVVVGAFANEQNALLFTESLKGQYPDVKMRHNPVRGLFYVVLQSSPDGKPAFGSARSLQQNHVFRDAWVYHGPLDEKGSAPAAVLNPPAAEDLNPSSGLDMPAISLNDKAVFEEDQEENPQPIDAESIVEEEPADSVEEAGLNRGKVFLKIFRASDNREIDGAVSVVDVDRSRKYATLDGNTFVNLPSPKSRTGRMLLVCDVFGYRQAQEAFNYNDSTGFEHDESGAMIVPFGLVRLQKGDVSVMYRVLFYNDAAIMRPESEVELKDLLVMMNENPRYKIRIHGHTNGNKGGKILAMGSPTAFFSLTNARETSGTAKKLSQRRAEVVRDYLVAKGIDEHRVEIKAWGGKLPLYEKNGPRAQENVRVEVEILEQ